MASAPRERISGVDTAWLRMDNPTNLMMIVGVMKFEHKLTLPAVKRVIASRFLAYRRFHSRAVQEATGAWWETPGPPDLDFHVVSARLRGKADKAQLEALVSKLASTPLDPSRPLWQYHLVENYAGGSALIIRIHHCYADGIALTGVVLSMTHATARGSLARKPGVIAPSGSQEADFWLGLLKPVTVALEGAAQLGKELLEQGASLASHPLATGDALQGALGKGMDLAVEAAKLVLMGSDAKTRFKGPLGKRKRAAWAESLPLEEVKVVGKALGCSINDVLLSLATGALRDYLADKGDPVDSLEIRAIVPVNLRPAGQAAALGNHFGLVFLDVPLGIEHPLERLYEIRRRMLALKGSYQPVIALALLSAVGYGPRALQEQVTQLLGRNASAVMTNVPGPQHPLYFAGQRIADLNFWVPQSGGIGLGISILSYDGRIEFGVITDAGLVPDPDRIVGRFADEFDKLLWLALMSPWGDDPGSPTPEASAPAPKVPKRFRSL